MKVIESDLATIKLRTVSEADRRLLWSWFDHLKNWENDEHTRSLSVLSRSKLLPGYQDVYVLETSKGPGLCIFFHVADEVITILDIAHRDTIRKFAPVAIRGGA